MEVLRCDLYNDFLENLTCAYLDAKEFIIEKGYAREIDWQESLSIESISESDFLRETAWVILSIGMKESVIRGLFDRFSEAFFNWESAEKISVFENYCKNKALKVFRHEKKVNAIIYMAQIINRDTFAVVLRNIKTFGTGYLETFPYLGPATSCHLAKNIGLNVAKPDRHLIRISKACGFQTPSELCNTLSMIVGDDIRTVDLVLWRYATLQNQYLEHFSACVRVQR